MSTAKMTASKAKLQRWADTRELDARAKELAEREQIPLTSAYLLLSAHEVQRKALLAKDAPVMNGGLR